MNSRILIVDDDFGVLRLYKRAFADLPVSTALGPKEGLQQLELASWAIVVSDMRMKGMDGLQLLAQVRERQPEAHRILISAFCVDQVCSAIESSLIGAFVDKARGVEGLRYELERTLKALQRVELTKAH